MSNTFGTGTDASQYLETPDPANPGQPMRPPAGIVLKFRDAYDATPLPDVTSEDYGYFDFVLDDSHPAVQISTDGGTTWGPVLLSEEIRLQMAKDASVTAALTQQIADVNTAVGNIQSSIGAPGGLATLDANGHVDAVEVVGIAPIVQNTDGSWPADPGGSAPIPVIRKVPGSSSSAPTWLNEARGDYMLDEPDDFAG